MLIVYKENCMSIASCTHTHTHSTASPEQLSYSPVVPQASPENVTQLGPRFTVRFVVRNAGPSTVPTTQLTVLWPSQGAESGSVYFLYPFSITVSTLLLWDTLSKTLSIFTQCIILAALMGEQFLFSIKA